MTVVRQSAAETAEATGRRRPSFHTLTVAAMSQAFCL